jgi:prepilin-type N-terminal cleavage/methylation domain-containing protein
MRQQQRAFTLLEVLIVISIIGILIALGVAAYSTAQRKSRDARRQSDIKALQSGFEQFRAMRNDYPLSWNDADDSSIFPSGLPSDPRTGTEYLSQFSVDAYCICAQLEASTGNASAVPATTSCSYGAGDYYCLSNLQ